MRFYFTAVREYINEAIAVFYCPLKDTQTSIYDFLDGREFPEIEDGWFFAWTDNTDAEHLLATAQPDITYLPTETAGGLLVDLDSPVSNISAPNRAVIIGELEARGIPTDGISLAMTVREAMRIIVVRIRIMEQLRYVDLSDMLETIISDIPTKRRKAMRRRLTNLGFDVSPITNGMTVRAALLELFSQNLIPAGLLPF